MFIIRITWILLSCKRVLKCRVVLGIFTVHNYDTVAGFIEVLCINVHCENCWLQKDPNNLIVMLHLVSGVSSKQFWFHGWWY